MISACDVGISQAGTTPAHAGPVFSYATAETLCASGYHLPTTTERLLALQNGIGFGLRNINRASDIGYFSSRVDYDAFSTTLLLPGYSGLNYDGNMYRTQGSDYPVFFTEKPTFAQAVIGAANASSQYPVRCFQDASVPAINEGIGQIEYFPSTSTTGTVTVQVMVNLGTAVIFTTPGWNTTDGGHTYTKTYSRNFSGEIISFDDGQHRATQEIAVTRIRPEVTFMFSPEESLGQTDDPVEVMIGFSRPDMTILNNS